MSDSANESVIERIESAAGLILGISEDRSWIEVFFEGDLMHTRTVNLPARTTFDIYVEEIPHKATVYQHPRTTVYFTGPCDLLISRDGDKILVTGTEPASESPGSL